MNHIQSPRTDDSAIEQEIKAKGLTAPRVTPDDLAANIASEHYFTAADGVMSNEGQGKLIIEGIDNYQALSLLTFCVLVLLLPPQPLEPPLQP
jgi:hypothetical protein